MKNVFLFVLLFSNGVSLATLFASGLKGRKVTDFFGEKIADYRLVVLIWTLAAQVFFLVKAFGGVFEGFDLISAIVQFVFLACFAWSSASEFPRSFKVLLRFLPAIGLVGVAAWIFFDPAGALRFADPVLRVGLPFFVWGIPCIALILRNRSSKSEPTKSTTFPLFPVIGSGIATLFWIVLNLFSAFDVFLLTVMISAAWNAYLLGIEFTSPHVRQKTPDDSLGGPLEEGGELSERELEIAKWLNQGLIGKEIAYELKIRPVTVKNHLYNMYKKTGTRGRVELLNCLRKKGLL